MSQAEIKRLIADLNTKPALLAGLKTKAAGVASVVAYASAAGYAFTAADAREYMRGVSLSGLSDAHLDHLAGGKSSPPQGASQTSTQTVDTAAVIVLGPVIGGQVVQVAQGIVVTAIAAA
jgi:hypothetical protein